MLGEARRHEEMAQELQVWWSRGQSGKFGHVSAAAAALSSESISI